MRMRTNKSEARDDDGGVDDGDGDDDERCVE